MKPVKWQALRSHQLQPADLTVRKRPGTSCQIEIIELHFAVFNPLYLFFCFINLVETW